MGCYEVAIVNNWSKVMFSKHRTIHRLVAIAAITAFVVSACGTDTETTPSVSGEVLSPFATNDSSTRESILPILSPAAGLKAADASEVHVAYAPEVPAPITRTDQRTFSIELEAIEGMCDLDPANGVTTEMWGFRVAGDTNTICGSPGPVLRGRVGDMAVITLTNLASNEHPHNIDFHAVTGQGGGAAGLVVAPGESATISVRLLFPGAFMYHCAFGDVPKHIAHGMYGMFIVDPETPLPEVDHEWAVMQSEWYVSEADADGVATYDPDSLWTETPRYVTFNGRTDALTGDNALEMQVGERSRIYMVNEGLNLDSNWHPIGSQWDVVYPEAATHPLNSVIRGSQSTLVVAGGGTVTELIGLVPSTVILVDHALIRTFAKGAIGLVHITGDANPEIYADGQTVDPTPAEPPADEPGAISIPDGAWDPGASDFFLPGSPIIAVGTTVTWTNNDAVAHTVTSGSSTGTVASPDGLFDSGDIAPGETFSYTFTEAGTFDYFCTPHPWMMGTVIVS